MSIRFLHNKHPRNRYISLFDNYIIVLIFTKTLSFVMINSSLQADVDI